MSFFIVMAAFMLVVLPETGRGVSSAAGQYLDGTVENEPIYGAEHMDESEINAYRKQIRECRTAAERQEFRNRTRQQIKKRTQQRIQTPDDGGLRERAGSGGGSRAMGSNTTFQKRRGGSGGGGGGWKKGGK
jgi:hypothetical protein